MQGHCAGGLFVPLGKAAQDALAFLAADGLVDPAAV
jgi:hypothetical protein